jgi:hypothetical protein
MVKVEFDVETWVLKANGTNKEILFVWSYSYFEDLVGYFITPSMYQVMTGYIQSEIVDDDLRAIRGQCYDYRPLVKKSVDYYYSLGKDEFRDMRRQTMYHIQKLLEQAEKKEASTMEILFDPDSPVYLECHEFIKELNKKYVYRRRYYERLLDEESNF